MEDLTPTPEARVVADRIEKLHKASEKLQAAHWASLLLGVLGTIGAGLLEFGFQEITRPKLLLILYVTAGFLITVMMFLFIVRTIKRAALKTETISANVQSAFVRALEDSFLNPNRVVGGKNAERFGIK